MPEKQAERANSAVCFASALRMANVWHLVPVKVTNY